MNSYPTLVICDAGNSIGHPHWLAFRLNTRISIRANQKDGIE
jgi:hypothetical protein